MLDHQKQIKFGLIGEKLGHSYSKTIHEQLASYSYELMPLKKEELDNFMKTHDFKAINVTIPYKREVIPYLDEIDENAKKIGAVNTIVNKNGLLYGYNTDYHGFLYTLRHNQISVANKKVLVIGNGGAAMAVFAVLRQEAAADIIVVKHKEELGTVTYQEAATFHSDAAIIINTSPVGMFPNTESTPMDLSPYHSCEAVVDLIYNPRQTLFLKQAADLGIKSVNGLEMLIAQAKYAVEYFLSITIPDEKIETIII